MKQLSLLSHQPSVLETAVKSGFYLGPIPNTPNHRELRDALPPDAVHEVYVTVVTVSDRPSDRWVDANTIRPPSILGLVFGSKFKPRPVRRRSSSPVAHPPG